MRGFEVRIDDRPVALSHNAQRVIAFLAVRVRAQLRTTVSSSLWADLTADRAAANLRSALWKLAELRHRLVHSFGGYLELDPGVEVDLTALIERARRLVVLNPLEPLAADDEALDGLADDLLPEWDEDWILFERERLRQLRVHALEALCRRLTSEGRFGEAIEAGLAAVASEPLRESAQRLLIGVHLAEGNISEARRQFERFRNELGDSLGIEPSGELAQSVGIFEAPPR